MNKMEKNQSGSAEPLEIDAEEQARQARQEHRREVGREIVKKYLPADRPERQKTAGEMVGGLLQDIPEEELVSIQVDAHDAAGKPLSLEALDRKSRNAWLSEKTGLSLDAKDKVRLQVPGRKDLPGSYFNEEVMKGLITGFKDAGDDVQKQWEVAAAACDYLGVEPPPKPKAEEIEEVKKSGGLMAWMQKKGKKAVGILALLALFEARPLLDMEMTASAAEPGGDGRAVAVEVSEQQEQFHDFRSGDNPMKVVQELYIQHKGTPPNFDQLTELTREFCQANGISSPNLGVEGGDTDEHQIPVGFHANITSTMEMMQGM